MSTILDLGKQHLPKVLAGDPEALKALFYSRVSGWGKTYAHEEEMTVGLFSDIDQEVESYVAFELIGDAVALALSEATNFDGFNCALDLICSLVDASGTTEIPGALRLHFPELESQAAAFGGEPLSSIRVIRKHYRNAL